MLGATVGGLVGSGGGQILYSLLGGGMSGTFLQQIIARTFGWTLLGAGMGMANGWMAGDKKRLVNGLIGGVAGGAAGGLVFDLICIPLPYGNGSAARLIGFLALGGGIGALIGLVEHLRREVWFAAIAPYAREGVYPLGAQTVFDHPEKPISSFMAIRPSVLCFLVEGSDDRGYRVSDSSDRGWSGIIILLLTFFAPERRSIGIAHLLQFRVKER